MKRSAQKMLRDTLPPMLLSGCYQLKSIIVDRWHGRTNNEQRFSDTYQRKLWGTSEESAPFYSGAGSYDASVSAYVAFLHRYFVENGIQTVVEIGCGDFAVAKQYASLVDRYVGIDVVPDLVAHHQRTYATDRISFIQADASREHIPAGDVCLIRQVLQHLSNADIERVLANVAHMPRLLVTEHEPASCDLKRKNLDKRSGSDTRLNFGSAVYLDAPPFDLDASVVLECEMANFDASPGERLRTIEIVRT